MWSVLVIPYSCSFCGFFSLLCFYFFVPYVESANSFWSETRSGIREKKFVFSAHGGKNTPQSRSKGNKIFKIQFFFFKFLISLNPYHFIGGLPGPEQHSGYSTLLRRAVLMCDLTHDHSKKSHGFMTPDCLRHGHTKHAHTHRPPDDASIPKHLWAHVLTGHAPASPVQLDLRAQALTLTAYRFRNNGGRQCAGGWKVKTMRRHKEATCSG